MITTYIYEGALKEIIFNPEKNKKNILTWIDITRPTAEDFKHIKKAYNIHPLLIQNCLSNDETPRHVESPGYELIVIAVLLDKISLKSTSLNCMIGNNLIVTTHQVKLEGLEALKSNKERLKKAMQEGQDFLLHTIINPEIEHFEPAIEEIITELSKTEDKVLKDPDKEIINNIFTIKKKTYKLKKIATKQRELLGALSRQSPFVTKKAAPYFRDSYDTMTQMDEQLASAAENILSLLEVHLTMNTKRTNEVMKVLTIIATIMMPLTLIASIYGMNFKFMPELYWKYGYYAALAIMATIGLVMIIYFKRKKWF